jgi:FtsZ-binding cell division protein ZapB
MTGERFVKIVEDQLTSCIRVLRVKGSDYIANADRLSNFKEAARESGIEPLQAWLVYFLKHIEAIKKFTRKEYHFSEPIEERIMDAINYLLLLRAMVEEMKEEEKTPEASETITETTTLPKTPTPNVVEEFKKLLFSRKSQSK